MMRKTIAIGIIALAALGGSLTCPVVEATTLKETNKMTEVEKQIEAVLTAKGAYCLFICSKKTDNEDWLMQCVREVKDGKTTIEVVISYPFTESWETTLKKAVVLIPATWKQTSFVKKDKEGDGEVEFNATGSDAKTIADVVSSIFLKLFKNSPDKFEVVQDQK